MSTTEREIKLVPSAEFHLPPLTDPGGGVFASPESVRTLVATYFDTEDLRITRSGASLRYRDPEGWTVKLPHPDGDGEVLARDEHTVPGDERVLPDAAIDLVWSLTRGAPVTAVATLATHRTKVVLHDAQGRPVGEVVDDHVEATFPGPDPVAAPVRFGEVELKERMPDVRKTIMAYVHKNWRRAIEEQKKRTQALESSYGMMKLAGEDMVEAPSVISPAEADSGDPDQGTGNPVG